MSVVEDRRNGGILHEISPVFSSFLPHLLLFLPQHFLVWDGGKKRADEDGEKSVDEK